MNTNVENVNNFDEQNQGSSSINTDQRHHEGEADTDLDQLYEESFKSLSEGEVLKGYVVHVDKEHVMVDIGSKSEGRIRLEEFLDKDGNVNVNVGDEVEALLVRWDGEEDDEALDLDDEEASEDDGVDGATDDESDDGPEAEEDLDDAEDADADDEPESDEVPEAAPEGTPTASATPTHTATPEADGDDG